MVDTSWAVIWNDPSPTMATTCRSPPPATAAPSAAPTDHPIEPYFIWISKLAPSGRRNLVAWNHESPVSAIKVVVGVSIASTLLGQHPGGHGIGRLGPGAAAVGRRVRLKVSMLVGLAATLAARPASTSAMATPLKVRPCTGHLSGADHDQLVGDRRQL